MAENMDSLKGSLTAAYTRWRPKYHLQPPFGWMNDPCGLGYDPGTGLYHVGYQWNPDDSEWGNIAWGVAWSLDLCTWKVSSKPSINPESDNKSLGVFTGCLRTTNLDGQQDGVVTICYTSVHNLPIHHTLPYTRGSERIHLATSTDHGRTWNPFANNPIVPQPPSDLDVIAWRDPYVAPWCSMDRALGKTPNESLYGIVSGGIRGRSPTTFLYSVASNALDRWEYLGPLVDIGLNYSLSRWSGDNGVNWEVANFVSLADGIGHFHDFLIMGVEGCVSRSNTVDEATMRSQNAQMWMCGTIEVSKGRPSMRYKYGGRLDHGSFYAGNSFWDPISRQQVIFGWILEEDLPKELRKQQEWAGLLSVPRVLKCIEMESVCGALKSTLDDITCMEKIPDESGTYTLRTLAAIPDRRLEKLRSMPAPTLSLGRMGPTTSLSIDTKHFELDASFSVKTGVQRVGISILHSSDGQYVTTLSLDLETETFTIDRSKSTTILGVNTSKEAAPHTLYIFKDELGNLSLETLDIRLFYDVSVLEVFVNERTAISTRLYPSSTTCYGLKVFSEQLEDAEAPELRRFDFWDITL